jgi:hypothetical protein
MIFRSSDGTLFQLEVRGYEYPDRVDDEWDSNWLRIAIIVSTSDGTWSVIHPCLLTFEISYLADWLDAVSERMQKESDIGFVEPNLSFELIEGTAEGPYLRVYFAAECLPPWADGPKSGTMFFLDFTLLDVDLRAAVESLRARYRTYPPRAIH